MGIFNGAYPSRDEIEYLQRVYDEWGERIKGMTEDEAAKLLIKESQAELAELARRQDEHEAPAEVMRSAIRRIK